MLHKAPNKYIWKTQKQRLFHGFMTRWPVLWRNTFSMLYHRTDGGMHLLMVEANEDNEDNWASNKTAQPRSAPPMFTYHIVTNVNLSSVSRCTLPAARLYGYQVQCKIVPRSVEYLDSDSVMTVIFCFFYIYIFFYIRMNCPFNTQF